MRNRTFIVLKSNKRSMMEDEVVKGDEELITWLSYPAASTYYMAMERAKTLIENGRLRDVEYSLDFVMKDRQRYNYRAVSEVNRMLVCSIQNIRAMAA